MQDLLHKNGFSYTIELRDYTQSHFFSSDTCFYPNWPIPKIDEEKSENDENYFYDTVGRKIAYKGTGYKKHLKWLGFENRMLASINEEVLKEEFNTLAPKAILYAASLIKHYCNILYRPETPELDQPVKNKLDINPEEPLPFSWNPVSDTSEEQVKYCLVVKEQSAPDGQNVYDSCKNSFDHITNTETELNPTDFNNGNGLDYSTAYDWMVWAVDPYSMCYSEAPPDSWRSFTTLADIYVDDDYPTPIHPDCADRTGSIDDPYCKIQKAIYAAKDGETVLVHAGTYYERITFLSSKTITVKTEEGATIDSNDYDYQKNVGSVVTFSTGSKSTLEGFIITGGTGKGSYESIGHGGGIYCYKSSPTINKCIIKGNRARRQGHGGGIYCIESSPLINYCTIELNHASRGGGIYFVGSSTPLINNSIIVGNWADFQGGGVLIKESSPVFVNSTIKSNFSLASTAGNGGGFYCQSASLNLIGCAVSGNNSLRGGGIYCTGSSLLLSNCIIDRNLVLTSGCSWSGCRLGGGIYSHESSVEIINSTIYGNVSASSYGGGIAYINSPSSEATLIIRNTIFEENRMYLSGGGTTTITFSNINPTLVTGDLIPTLGNNINTPSLFVEPDNGDFHLQPGSLCINKGTTDNAPEYDFEGDPRLEFVGGDNMPDIGADEVVFNP